MVAFAAAWEAAVAHALGEKRDAVGE